jgi:uncharacterized pyridoxamine 5'-phosphate oxidase family protein
MKDVCEYLKKAGFYYLATVEGDQPKVRPFGTAHIFENKLYFQTGKSKPVAAQIAKNPKVSISAMADQGSWLRIEATAVQDDRIEARKSMLDAYPALRDRYNENDGKSVVYYLKDASASIESFTAAPKTYKF